MRSAISSGAKPSWCHIRRTGSTTSRGRRSHPWTQRGTTPAHSCRPRSSSSPTRRSPAGRRQGQRTPPVAHLASRRSGTSAAQQCTTVRHVRGGGRERPAPARRRVRAPPAPATGRCSSAGTRPAPRAGSARRAAAMSSRVGRASAYVVEVGTHRLGVATRRRRAPRRGRRARGRARSAARPTRVHGSGELNLERPVVSRGAPAPSASRSRSSISLGAAHVHARSRHQPPAGRLQVHVQVDEGGRGPSDHVGARAARGQLGQVRKVGQLGEDRAPTPHRCPRRAASRCRLPSRRRA